MDPNNCHLPSQFAFYLFLLFLHRETLKKEGVVRGLYAGTIPSLAANVAENSILFAAYGVCQKQVANALGTEVAKLSTLNNGCAGKYVHHWGPSYILGHTRNYPFCLFNYSILPIGFLAAFWSSLALCPTELVKCRLQAMRESHLERGLDPPRIGPFKLTGQILRHGKDCRMRTCLIPLSNSFIDSNWLSTK